MGVAKTPFPDPSANIDVSSQPDAGAPSEAAAALSQTAPSASDLEATLAQVRGIYASRAILGARRQISELHVVTSTTRRPKQIIRDIETLLLVKHGLRVDYRKISLVQLANEDLLRLPLARPEIREVVEDNMGDRRRVRVEIQGAGRIVHGETWEQTDNPNPFRAAVAATVQCVEALVGRQIDARVENVAPIRLDTREVVLVILTCLIDNREETFVGASFIGSRQAESAARATLDALNRRIFTLTASKSPVR